MNLKKLKLLSKMDSLESKKLTIEFILIHFHRLEDQSLSFGSKTV
jgi:hypothetical protein